MPLVRISPMVLMLLLAACQTGPLADLRAIDFRPFGRSASPAPPAAQPVSTRTAEPKSQPRPKENPALAEPERLIGMNEGATLALLGKPDSVNQEAQAELWHYRRRPGCELVLFLYVDLTTRNRHVLAYESRTPAGAPADLGCTTERTANRE